MNTHTGKKDFTSKNKERLMRNTNKRSAVEDKNFLATLSSPKSAPRASGIKTNTTTDEYNNRYSIPKTKKYPVQITAATYNLALKSHAEQRRAGTPVTPMIEIYNEMKLKPIEPDTYTYVLMIRNLCKRDVEVQKTVAMLKRQSERSGLPNTDVALLEAEGNLKKALAIFREAVDNGVSVNTVQVEIFNELLRVLSHYGHNHTADATFVYNQLKEPAVHAKPNSATYAALINLFGRAGDIDKSLDYYNVYTKEKDTMEPHDPSYIFNALVDCHLKCGLLDKALSIVEHDMVDNGIKLTCIPYNSIIRHYCTHNQMSEAEDLINRLKESNNTYVIPDASSYGPVLSAYCQADAWEAATRIYDALIKTDITKAYGNLAKYALLCLTHQFREKALCVIQDMTQAKLEPDPALAESIIVSFAQAKQVAQAITALHTLQQAMSSRSLARGSHHIMHGALKVISHCTSVMQVLQVMHAVNNYNSNTSSSHYYKSMSKALVDLYFDQAKDSQTPTKLTLADFQILFDAVFIVYDRQDAVSCSLGNAAMQLLEHMRTFDVAIPSNLYNRVLTQFQRCRDLESESRWKNAFKSPLSLAASFRHVQNDEDDIIVEIAQEPEQEKADKRASDIHSVAPAANTGSTTLSEAEIISNKILKTVVDGKYSEAIDIFENRIIRKGLIPTPESMRDVIALAGKKGDIQTALTMYNKSISVFKDIADAPAKEEAIYMATNSLLIGYAQEGNMAEAKVYYDCIKAMGRYPDSDGYASLLLGSAKCATDEATDALAIYEEAKRYLVKPTTFFYNATIIKLAKARKLDCALKLFEEMRLFKIRANSITYGAMISASVRSGSESQSRRLFDEMLSSPSYQPHVGPFNNMMQFYVRQHPDRARVLEYFAELRRRQIKPSSHSYKLLMEAYTHIAPYDMSMADKLLNDMVKCDRLCPQATHYATLVYSYGILQRDVQSAERMFDAMRMSNIDPDEAVYQAMIDTLISNNALEKAETVYYQKMQKDTKLKKSGSPYIENLFIRGYGETLNLEKAEKLFKAMSDHKNLHHVCVIREPSTYEAMIRAYLSNNKVEQAKIIFDKMNKRDFPPKVIGAVADLFLK